LVYGHNLNQGDIGVPGMVFINKRGIFKMGKTWSELATKEQLRPSSHSWISRYGSVTFNALGRDLADGGMNEAGLYIWEMNEDGDYPKNDRLPRLYELNWMQYILDNYSTVEEAIRCACEIEVEGPGKHFFVGDAGGDCAAIAFIDSQVVVNRGETMTVPGLFNTPYAREIEVLKHYRGFGGLYEPDLSDLRVPRFVKTAVMLRDYDPTQNIVDYGFAMLDSLKVYDIPEWSIIFDVKGRLVYFKTRINPEIKKFSMEAVDFSNKSPVLILNMDIEEGGDVLDKFHPYTSEEMRRFIETFLLPILPEDVITRGGITRDEYVRRTATHSDAAALSENQFFKGIWRNKPENPEEDLLITVTLETEGDAVSGRISFSEDPEEFYTLDHIHLIGNDLRFTFETDGERNKFLEIQGTIQNEGMNVTLLSKEDNYGSDVLIRESER
jgi:choloylglycine hydrolase